jgi:preprotein translocase subunit SecA
LSAFLGFKIFIMGIFNSILQSFLGGNKSSQDIKQINPLIEAIHIEYSTVSQLDNDSLREKSLAIKTLIREAISADQNEIESLRKEAEAPDINLDEKEKRYNQIDKIEKGIRLKVEEQLNEYLPLAFAIVKETAKRFKENTEVVVTANDHDRYLATIRDFVRIEGQQAIYRNQWMAGGNMITWDMVHYDVQLIGGVVLHQGKISEMATGEGKTLVATLPVFLNALSGRGVHLVTVNDYLARRDSEWMGPLYEFHGLTVDCIDRHQPNSEARRKAYLADITFGTNNEFGFDYLRDNMAVLPEDLVQRGHNYAIVDEVDSVLIDDARTPLIISGPTQTKTKDEALFYEFKPKVEKLYTHQRNLVNKILTEAREAITKKDDENAGFLLLRAFKGLPKNKALIKLLSETGNKALLTKTENTYMQDNSRNMFKVTDELFFVIDEKNNSIELSDKGIDLISGDVNEPDFFILPDIGSRVADIEKRITDPAEKLLEKDRMIGDYAVKSERLHTIQQLLKAYALFEKDIEYVVMDNKVKIVDEQTGRILDGRRYSDGLHQAIEAKESVKVEASTQTFATITLQNYFRMYNKLAGMTGTAETEAGEFWNIYKLDVVVIPTNRSIIRKDREDLVYKTKREKYNAVIEEIQELVRAERPVLVGTTSVEVSELLSRMLTMKKVPHNVLNAKLHQKEAAIVAEAGKEGTVTIATNMAGRGTDIKLSPRSKEGGGLAIIGTERHDSRRVDRQLRGRSGRQGDPGSSQFFVSLEDDLMRLFGSDRIAGIMDRLGLKEGEVIQHSMITKSIERAQKKVEENNFGIRKNLLEYDDVMNAQREVIYRRRRNALFGERIEMDISNMVSDLCESMIQTHQSNSDYAGLMADSLRFLAVEPPMGEKDFLKEDPMELSNQLFETVSSAYHRKSDQMAAQAWPLIHHVYTEQSHLYNNIVFPISDGLRVYQVIANLKRSDESQGKELVRSFEKSVILQVIDEAWKDHLRQMDDLKLSVRSASYEQKDPLLIYKLEAFELFRTMLDKINRDVVMVLMKGQLPQQDPQNIREAQAPKRPDMSRMQANRNELSAGGGSSPDAGKHQPAKAEKKVGRNDPCPCGSGKKYKACHGIGATA